MTRRPPQALLALALVASLAACARGTAERAAADSAQSSAPSAAGAPAAPQGAAPGAAGDLAAVQRLEQEARALARTEGCASAGQCAVAPVGARPCGGPRTYVAYCPLTTDTAALHRTLDELLRQERAYNEKSGMMSTCEMREPPEPTLSGGRCTAAGGR